MPKRKSRLSRKTSKMKHKRMPSIQQNLDAAKAHWQILSPSEKKKIMKKSAKIEKEFYKHVHKSGKSVDEFLHDIAGGAKKKSTHAAAFLSAAVAAVGTKVAATPAFVRRIETQEVLCKRPNVWSRGYCYMASPTEIPWYASPYFLTPEEWLAVYLVVGAIGGFSLHKLRKRYKERKDFKETQKLLKKAHSKKRA